MPSEYPLCLLLTLCNTNRPSVVSEKMLDINAQISRV